MTIPHHHHRRLLHQPFSPSSSSLQPPTEHPFSHYPATSGKTPFFPSDPLLPPSTATTLPASIPSPGLPKCPSSQKPISTNHIIAAAAFSITLVTVVILIFILLYYRRCHRFSTDSTKTPRLDSLSLYDLPNSTTTTSNDRDSDPQKDFQQGNPDAKEAGSYCLRDSGKEEEEGEEFFYASARSTFSSSSPPSPSQLKSTSSPPLHTDSIPSSADHRNTPSLSLPVHTRSPARTPSTKLGPAERFLNATKLLLLLLK